MMGTTHRRAFLRGCLMGAASLASSGCSEVNRPARHGAAHSDAAGESDLETVPFLGEDDLPMEQPFGYGLDGRLFTDLTHVAAESLVTPTERFFIRTRCSELLENSEQWEIRLGGLVKGPKAIKLAELRPQVMPAGTHVMECSGNTSGGHFGLLSAASWSGIPISQVLERCESLPPANQILISGFDEYSRPSRHRSLPGASWIFTREQLERAGAFLATEMNGAPLTPDHGAPVRLMVPGWYGCTCIKWVNRIEFVSDQEPATSQMREFAARTHQDGEPTLARGYRPAALEQAAMALRVERRRSSGSPEFRVTGITWGGKRVTEGLVIRFNPDEEFRPVEIAAAPGEPTTWALWTYDWKPARAGDYAIQLRIDRPEVPQLRLDMGHYTRYVRI